LNVFPSKFTISNEQQTEEQVESDIRNLNTGGTFVGLQYRKHDCGNGQTGEAIFAGFRKQEIIPIEIEENEQETKI
jgi:hypothetical protein